MVALFFSPKVRVQQGQVFTLMLYLLGLGKHGFQSLLANRLEKQNSFNTNSLVTPNRSPQYSSLKLYSNCFSMDRCQVGRRGIVHRILREDQSRLCAALRIDAFSSDNKTLSILRPEAIVTIVTVVLFYFQFSKLLLLFIKNLNSLTSLAK